MKKSLINAIYLVSTITFISCAPTDKIIQAHNQNQENIVQLTKDNLDVINGDYYPLSQKNGISLWPFLFNSEDEVDSLNCIDQKIRLSTLSNKKIKFERFCDGTIVASQIVKGKVRSHLFQGKKRTKIKGIPLLAWELENQVTVFGLDRNRNLMVYSNAGGALMLILAPMMASNRNAPDIPMVFARLE